MTITTNRITDIQIAMQSEGEQVYELRLVALDDSECDNAILKEIMKAIDIVKSLAIDNGIEVQSKTIK